MNTWLNIREKILCPTFWIMTGSLVLLLSLHALWYNYNKNKSFYDNNYIRDSIEYRLKDKQLECGKNAFFSYLVVDHNKFRFGDIFATNGREAFSLKKIDNSIYNNTYLLNKSEIDFVSDIPTGWAGYYKISELKEFSTLQSIVAKANQELEHIAFSLARNKKKDVVYLFVFSKNANYSPCSKGNIVNFLTQISLDIEFLIR